MLGEAAARRGEPVLEREGQRAADVLEVEYDRPATAERQCAFRGCSDRGGLSWVPHVWGDQQMRSGGRSPAPGAPREAPSGASSGADRRHARALLPQAGGGNSGREVEIARRGGGIGRRGLAIGLGDIQAVPRSGTDRGEQPVRHDGARHHVADRPREEPAQEEQALRATDAGRRKAPPAAADAGRWRSAPG